MYQIDFTTPIHIHFIGIGGISMSGLAEILLEEGFTITGSDSKESPLTRHLEEKGARIYYGQKASNIEAEPGIQVVSILQLSTRTIRNSRQQKTRTSQCLPEQNS